MGIGSSRNRYRSQPRRRSPAPKQSKKRRRGLRKLKPAPTTQSIPPIRYYSPRRYSYGSRPFSPPISAYAPLPLSVLPRYMPMYYNNYPAPFYIPPRQPIMIPPQQVQPMLIPQQVPLSQPFAMPQQVPQYQPMQMPQQVSPSMFSPYMSSPYSMGIPLSTPYAQQQPQVQPNYNNIGGVSTPAFTGMTGINTPYSFPRQATTIKLFTDWTGGGKISPGFLGPPI